MPKSEKLPVIFRCDHDGSHVTAVFPSLAHNLVTTCYEHVGQHSECDYRWYLTTRPAKPAEYADLLAELRGIYENDQIFKLYVMERWSRG